MNLATYRSPSQAASCCSILSAETSVIVTTSLALGVDPPGQLELTKGINIARRKGGKIRRRLTGAIIGLANIIE